MTFLAYLSYVMWMWVLVDKFWSSSRGWKAEIPILMFGMMWLLMMAQLV